MPCFLLCLLWPSGGGEAPPKTQPTGGHRLLQRGSLLAGYFPWMHTAVFPGSQRYLRTGRGRTGYSASPDPRTPRPPSASVPAVLAETLTFVSSPCGKHTLPPSVFHHEQDIICTLTPIAHLCGFCFCTQQGGEGKSGG